MYNLLQKAVTIPVAAVVLVFFLMNVNFYPQLLTYQAGQNLAAITKGKVDPEDVYVQPKGYSYSSSYTFYAKSQFHTFDDSLIGKKNKLWMVAEPSNIDTMMARYQTGEIYRVPHFRVTKLNLKFLNPSTRDKELSEMMLVEILGKKNK